MFCKLLKDRIWASLWLGLKLHNQLLDKDTCVAIKPMYQHPYRKLNLDLIDKLQNMLGKFSFSLHPLCSLKKKKEKRKDEEKKKKGIIFHGSLLND